MIREVHVPGAEDFDDVESLLALAASPGIRPGLERVRRLLELLGNPQDDYPALHVVGTNGKGSTCAFLESVLRAAGYRTAFYSSPHLESPGHLPKNPSFVVVYSESSIIFHLICFREN